MAVERVPNAGEALKAAMRSYEVYTDNVLTAVVKATNKTAREEAEAVKEEAEHEDIERTGRYIDGITYKKASSKSIKFLDIEAVIYNKYRPQISHLLEYGHDVYNKYGILVGHAAAHPHFKSNEENFNKVYVERVIEAIQKAGG